MIKHFLCLLTLLTYSSSFLLFGQQCQSTDFTFSVPIPDSNPAGISVDMEVSSQGTLGFNYVLDSIHINITHTYVGDLKVCLINPSADTIVLFDQPGVPASTYGCGNDDVNTTFSNNSNLLAENICYALPALAGNLKPINPFSQSGPMDGTWILFVSDLAGGDIGIINSATLYFTPLWYQDQDGDLYGAGNGIRACTQPQNHVAQNGDCNNNNPNIYPGAPEICGNKIDEDCTGEDTDYLYQPHLSAVSSNGFCEGDSALLLISPFVNGDSVEWFYNQSPISSNTGNFLYASASGEYTVAVIMVNGCYFPINTVQITEYPAPNPVITASTQGLSTGNYALYTWYLNGQLIPSANDANWMPQANGTYQVEVTDSNGCTGMSSTFVLGNASIHENETNTFNIYPNPASDFVWIYSNATQNNQIEIVDVQGKIVYNKSNSVNPIMIDVRDLKAGIYFVRIGNVIKKLVKQ